MDRFKQINRSCSLGTLPLDNYSGFKPGDRVVTRHNGEQGTVTDVRFINTPSSALYYVHWTEDTTGQERCNYPNLLRKL